MRLDSVGGKGMPRSLIRDVVISDGSDGVSFSQWAPIMPLEVSRMCTASLCTKKVQV